MSETPAPWDAVLSSDFDAQYRRLFEAAECKTQAELATVLEIRQASVSNAKRRQSVPAPWLVKLLEKKHINPQWIRTGLGDKVIKPAGTDKMIPSSITVPEYSQLKKYTTDELFAEILQRAKVFHSR